MASHAIDAAARQRLRDARSAAGVSLRELARRIGVSASQLSQIENGRSSPSVSTLYALVSELDISLDALFDEPRPARQSARSHGGSNVLLHPGERAVLDIDSGVRWERLTGPTEDVDALLTTYDPGGSSSSSGKLMVHAGTEYAYLFEGELVLRLGFEQHLLRAGDSLTFHSATPHLYVNEGTVPARGVWFVVDRAVHGGAGLRHGGNNPGPRRFTSTVEAFDALHKHRGVSDERSGR